MRNVRGKLVRKLAVAMIVSLTVGCVAPAGMGRQQAVYAAVEDVKKIESANASAPELGMISASGAVEDTDVVATEKENGKKYVNVEPGTSVKLKEEGFTVEFRAESTWEGYCSFHVTLTNTGIVTMKNWSLNYVQAGEITQIWSAEPGTQGGNSHTIENAGWNESIAPGEAVGFGYILQGQEIAFPTEVTYAGAYEEAIENVLRQGAVTYIEKDGFTVEFKAESVWENHCTVNVILTNTGTTAMEEWSLSYAQKGRISQIWNAEQKHGDDTMCNICGLEWNKKIEPGASVSFGYIAEGDALELPDDAEFTGNYVPETECIEAGTGKTIQGNGFSAEFYVESVWENHCSIKATLTNTSVLPMRDWGFAIEQQGEILQIWNAEVESHEGVWYQIRNSGWNKEVFPGEKISFEYILQGDKLELPSKGDYTGVYASADTPTLGMSKYSVSL